MVQVTANTKDDEATSGPCCGQCSARIIWLSESLLPMFLKTESWVARKLLRRAKTLIGKPLYMRAKIGRENSRFKISK